MPFKILNIKWQNNGPQLAFLFYVMWRYFSYTHVHKDKQMSTQKDQDKNMSDFGSGMC